MKDRKTKIQSKGRQSRQTEIIYKRETAPNYERKKKNPAIND